jgi:hypothetical protein
VVVNKVVEDNAYFAFRKAQMKAMHTERLGVIHVSDLIKACVRNVMYGKFTPPEHKLMSTEDMKSLYFGQAIHSASEVADPDKHEMFLAYDYEQDKALTYEEAKKIPQDDPRQLDIIYGSIDDLIEVEGEYVISDKKTTGSIEYFQRHNSSASDSHMAQINCYRALLNKCYDIDAKRGCVIYISNSISKEKYDKPTPISFLLKKPEETLITMIETARKIKESILSKKLPERTRCYLCDGMCPYANRCFETFGDKDDIPSV